MSFLGGSDTTPNTGDRYFLMERELQNLKLKNSMLQEFSDNLKQQLEDSEKALQKSRHDNYEIAHIRDNLKNEIENLKEEVKKLKEEKIDILELLKSKNSEINSLRDTLQSIQSTELNAERSSISSLNELKLRFLDERVKEKDNLYQNQIQLLNQELENKTNECLNIRKESNEKLLEANMKIENQADEINNLKLEINRLKKLNESKDAKNEELSNTLVDLQVNFTKLETTFNKESEAQNDIINLLMKNVEDKEKESKSKDKSIVELRELLQKGYDAHSELELHFESMKENYIKDVKELEEERKNLLEQLEQAKSNLEAFNTTTIEKEFQKHFPIASETNRKLNNVVNLSDLYDELVKTKQEMTRVIAENIKLKKEMDELREKVDEDKPLLYKNIHDFEMIEQNYAKMNEKLMQLLAEKDKYMSEKDTDTQTINTLKREILRYQQENNDLSLQITYLMKNIHDNSNVAEFDEHEESADNGNIGGRSRISNDLIVYKDIQDLQEKNRMLLTLLHEMNNELQNKEESCGSPNENQLKTQIETYKKDIENLQTELNKKNEIIELSSKQKRLMNPNYSAEFDPIELITENKELKLKLNKYSDELEDARKKGLEDIRRLETAKNGLIEENANVKSELLRLNSELKNQRSHFEEMNSILEKYQNENTLLRERNIKLNSSIENLEKNIIDLKTKLDQLNETIKSKDSYLEFNKAEIAQLRSNSEYLIKENSRLHDDVKNQSKLFHSLNILQENCDKVENDTIKVQSKQIERLEKDCANLRKWILEQKDKMRENDEKLNRLNEMLHEERNKYLHLQQEHYDLKIKSQTKQLVQQTDNMANIHHEHETILPSHSSPAAFSGNVKKELQNALDEVKILKGKLVNSEEKCQNLQSINITLEENLNKLAQNNKDIKNNIDSEIQTKINTINQLNQDLKNIHERYEKILTEKNNEIQQLEQSKDDYAKQIKKLQLDLNEIEQALEKAHHNEREVLNDIKIQSIIATKAQEDYENVIELRNKDAQTIFELKVKFDNSQKKIIDLENETEKLKSEFKTNLDILENDRKTLTQECEKLRIKCATLEQVNDTLSNQLEQLNNQIIALQNNSNMFMLDENQQKESANRLSTIIKFLREEKAHLQFDISKINDENSRLKIEIDNYKKEIDNLKSTLQMEKESSNRLNSMNEFKEILAKAQMVPVLSENNSQLKIQVSQLEKKCNELNEKLKSLESKEKSLQNLSNKQEEEENYIQFLKKEIEIWQSKANALQQQLKNFDQDNSNDKTLLGKQIRQNNAEIIRLKNDLENKTRSLLISEQELNNLKQKIKQITEEKDDIHKELGKTKNDYVNLQNVNVQLRSLARRYKAEISKMQVNPDGNKTTDKDTEFVDKEIQCDLKEPEIAVTPAENDEHKEMLIKVESLNNELQRLNEENESLKKHASNKEEVAKRIAQQAKQRISEITMEKSQLIKEKEELSKILDDLKAKVSQLTSDNEQYEQLRNQYDSQVSQLQQAKKQIENLTSHINQQKPMMMSHESPKAPLIQITTTSSSTSSSTSKSSSSTVSTAPVRHSVLPQQQQQQQPSTSSAASIFSVKPTPTVSIKPMPVSLPQATVQPTQAISISNASSTSVSSSSIPSTSQTEVEVSEASSQTHPANNQTALKRNLGNTSFDEPSSSNYKKAKTGSSTSIQQDESDEDINPIDPSEQIRDPYIDFGLEASQANDEDEDFQEDTESQVKESNDEDDVEDGDQELSNEAEMMEDEEVNDEEDEEGEDEEEDDDEEQELAEEDNLEDDARSLEAGNEEEDDDDNGDNDSICLADEEQEEDDDDDVNEEQDDKIEVIELNSDSDEEQEDSNDMMTINENVSEVTSSHVSSNEQLQQDPASTSTHDDSNEEPRQINTNVVTSQPSQSTSQLSDSEAVTSQSSSSTMPTSNQQQQQHPNISSELATSTSSNTNVSSQNINRVQRRPVLWNDNPNNNNTVESMGNQQRPGSLQHNQQQNNPRQRNRMMRNLRRGINRNRRNFRF